MQQILIKFGHGLGDVTQFSVILKHLKKYRPDWVVDVRVGRGKHTALNGLCRRVYHDQEDEPRGPYDNVLDLGWWENYSKYTDRPNSKITNCLQEVFGIPYDAALGRYKCKLGTAALHRAKIYLCSVGAKEIYPGKFGAVIIHYEGNTSPSKKNLAHWQAQELCDLTLEAGRVPVILDWDRRSGLPDNKRIFNPGISDHDIWGAFGSGDAETIAALVASAEAYVGIDSGPGKLASTTETPTLICWRGHHPIQFHDPAPNTVHLIPDQHRRVPPCCDQKGIAEYFEQHYRFLTYDGEYGLAREARRWLAEVLHHEQKPSTMTKFVLPPGIGDTTWALLKIRQIAPEPDCIDIVLPGTSSREVDKRSIPFLRRFKFVRDVQVLDIPLLVDREHPTNSRGRYNYMPDGLRDGRFHYLVPNTALENGRRIEDWLPHVKIDWEVFNHFDWRDTERGTRIGQGLGGFVAFYLGPEGGHCDEGHNWKWLWKTEDWIKLGHAMKERGMQVVVVGAPYDRSLWERYIKPAVAEAGLAWADLIGKFEIGETLALLREARCLISYQCGLGIVTHYLGGRVATWWRPEGKSAHPKHLVSFSEDMRHCWTRPEYQDRYMGLIYERDTPESIVKEMDERGWLR